LAFYTPKNERDGIRDIRKTDRGWQQFCVEVLSVVDVDLSQLQQLIDKPAESLSVELKSWIDPDQPEGAAKIVKAALALRNHGGGYLIIGFNNDTREPEKYNLFSRWVSVSYR
jgi:hypothetical protein